jgi:hypothetical protein
VYIRKGADLKRGTRFSVRMIKYEIVDGKRRQRAIFLGNYTTPAEAEEIKIRALELMEVQALTGEEVRNKINCEAPDTRRRVCRKKNRRSVEHLYNHQAGLVNKRTFHVTNM